MHKLAEALAARFCRFYFAAGGAMTGGRGQAGGSSATGRLLNMSSNEKQNLSAAAGAGGGKAGEQSAGRARAAAKQEGKARPPLDAGQERRDFLYIAAGLMGACGAAAFAAPFIGQLRPDSGQAGAEKLEVDISAVKRGEQLLVQWRGRPVIIRNRTAAEVMAAKQAALAALEDNKARNANLPASALADDLARSGGQGRENWLVFVNICTHLGCPTEHIEGGWFCPCHGSRYDSAARVIKGPANRNMAIPPYRFLSDARIEIG